MTQDAFLSMCSTYCLVAGEGKEHFDKARNFLTQCMNWKGRGVKCFKTNQHFNFVHTYIQRIDF